MTNSNFDAIKRRPFETIAAQWGYVRDPRASTRNNPVLRAPGQPKLVTQLGDNGHWTYFNTVDFDDNGTAIDFLLRRGLSFAAIRTRYAASPSRDFHSQWHRAIIDPAPAWLVHRGILPETLKVCRPRIRRDPDDHVLFAHLDRDRALTGFEISPPDGVRRFASGGTRSLFSVFAGTINTIETLFITEGAINALSLAQIERCHPACAVLSTGGAPSKRQLEQISVAARILPNVRTVALAQDNDAAGDRQAATLRDRLDVPAHVTVRRHPPPGKADWNDIVRATPQG